MFLATESLSRIIGFDSQLIFDSLITAVNILILFAGLSYFLYNPVRKMLTTRQEKIKEELKDAKDKQVAANDLKNEYEEKLKSTRIEIDKMLDDARRQAKTQSDEIIANARKEAADIVERGNHEILLEKEKAMDELKGEVVNISTMLATKIIKKNVDQGMADEMFNETLAEIGDSIWQS